MDSDILKAMQGEEKKERRFWAVVDHSGFCMGHSFKRGQRVILPESVIRALGLKVRVYEEVVDDVAGREPVKPLDRMIHGNEVVKK